MYLGSPHRLQPIDIEPAGNTVNVSLEADNPFESTKDIEVYTQMSGGIADPDPEMQSHDILTPVLPGAQGMFAVSGLGNAPAQPQTPTIGQQAALAAVNTALNVGTSVFNNWLQNQQAKRDERLMNAQARVQAEHARIADAQARASAAHAQAQTHAQWLAQQQANRQRTTMLLAIGGGVLVLGLLAVLFLGKKGGQ